MPADSNLISFHKMHGTANDFIVVDEGTAGARDWARLAVALCDRHRGIGADGILLLGRSDAADLRMRLINADGSEAEMCGNGIRCTARFALDTGITDRRELTWETGAGLVRTEVIDHGDRVSRVRVDMGHPRLRPEEIPVLLSGADALHCALDVDGHTIEVSCVSMGNPHAVTFVDEQVDGFPMAEIGPAVERHPLFPERTNFEVAQVLSPTQVQMRVWERGVGETMSCGTGACAVAVASRLVKGAEPRLDISVPGGHLELEWRPGEPVMLTGPAETVFAGDVDLALGEQPAGTRYLKRACRQADGAHPPVPLRGDRS
jgi:diaminopimelate epimerase